MSRSTRARASTARAAAVVMVLSMIAALVVTAIGADTDAVDPSEVAVSFEPFVAGLDRPTDIVFSEQGLALISEQPGRIKAHHDGSAAEPIVVLDITERVILADSEHGLLGLALHPAFASNGRIFVHYTRQPDGAVVISEIAYRDGHVDPGSERPLLSVTMPDTGHMGGMLTFDSDGFLLASIGDGKAMDASRDPDRLLGKIFRLDVDSETPYSEDLSLVATGSHRFPELVATGLRNPWRFDIDDLTGDLIIADVGHGAWEEIDILPAGSGVLDFGWSSLEGPQCRPLVICDADDATPPVIAYPHDPNGGAIGGIAYRGDAEPALRGLYLFADYSDGSIRVASLDGMAAGAAVPSVVGRRPGGDVRSFAEAPDGSLYVVGAAGIDRVVAERVGPAPMPAPTATPRLYPASSSVSRDISQLQLRPSTGPTLDTAAFEAAPPNDLDVTPAGPGCLALQPTGPDPYLRLFVPGDKGILFRPGAPGPLEVFLEVEGSTPLEQRRTFRFDGEVELTMPPRLPAEVDVIRLDPPIDGRSEVCAFTRP